jgi:radical SAM-linked protein
LGFVSDAEYLDLQLSEPYTSLFFQRLDRALPPGFRFLEARPVLGKSDSLSFIINLATYEVRLGLGSDQARALIESIMASQSLVVQRTSKEVTKDVDIKRHIVRIDGHAKDDGALLEMHLGLGTGGYARPEEVLVHGFGLSPKEVAGLLIRRTGLFVRKQGRILTPMEVV